jgi:hypothetical protein
VSHPAKFIGISTTLGIKIELVTTHDPQLLPEELLRLEFSKSFPIPLECGGKKLISSPVS